MEIIKLTFNDFYENTYILFDHTKECIIVDPGNSTLSEDKELFDTIEKHKLTPTLLINTHCHLDHVFGNGVVSEKYGLTPKINIKESIMLENYPRICEMYGLKHRPSPKAEEILKEGTNVEFGKTVLQVFETPGHSPGSICLYDEKGETIIVGDVLFRESIGRTDLPGCNHDNLIQSIKTKLFTLPKQTKVYSGHGENTTIGYEMAHNPFL
jgi:glyoxylase-like metal-dependent hydrolase (beta-lactamase superfamily II)